MITRLNKGFTLVEMIVVILLIGIISLIAVPLYSNIINDSEINAYKASMFTIINELEKYVISNPKVNFLEERDITSIQLNIEEGDKLISGKFYKDNSLIVLINVTDGKLCANGNKNNLQVKKGNCQ